MIQNNLNNTHQFESELTVLLFNDVNKSLFASVLCCLALIFVIDKNLPTNPSIIWSVIIFITYFLRYNTKKLYIQHKPTISESHIWLNRFRLSTGVCGLAWGSASFFIFPQSNEMLAFFAFILGGVCAGALINYSIDSITAALFVGGVALMGMPAFLISDNHFSKIILLVTIFFVSYVAFASRRLARGLLDNLSLRIEAEHQKSEISLLSLRQNHHLEHTPMGVIEWDKALNVSSWNNACHHIFGYTSDQAIGKHISFFMPNLSKKSNEHIVEMLLIEEQNQTNIKDITHKNGDIIYCEWFNTVLKNNHDEILGLASLVQDKTDFIKSQEEIHKLAYYDALTSLPNRRLLHDRLNKAITASKNAKSFGMIAFIDLDHFKAINDIKGHDAGDFLLKTVADRLKSSIRKQDTVARMGGDEFVLVLSDVGKSKKTAKLYSQKIIEKIASAIKIPLEYDGYQHQCSASIGLCVFKGDQLSTEELLRRADMSMYLAKKQGRNCYQFYDDSLQPKYEYQLQLKQDLNNAIATNQFQLYLQGQFDRNAKAIGAEVLLRWQHPHFGMVLPNDFIPLAEETGLIVPIGSWVMQQACALLKKWECSPDTQSLTISVNVSAIQFNNPAFIDQVTYAIKSTGCNAKKLCIELTESAVVNSIEDLTLRMQLLRDMGISLAIDDFGIGYSSLSILKDLPLNELKIDKTFVQDITNSGVESTIVRTILQMGKNLKLRIVAEGVESEHQLAYLRNYGCNLFQGYFFELPCAIDVFEQHLNEKFTKELKAKQLVAA